MLPLLSSPLAYFFLPFLLWVLYYIVQGQPAVSFGAWRAALPLPMPFYPLGFRNRQYRLTVSYG